jgi:hypothetical protein
MGYAQGQRHFVRQGRDPVELNSGTQLDMKLNQPGRNVAAYHAGFYSMGMESIFDAIGLVIEKGTH